MKKILTAIIIGLLCFSMFSILAPKVNASSSFAPDVVCVPFNGQLAGVPHDAWIGKEIILKGTAHDKDGDGTMVAYKWDFGDGYSTDWISTVNPYIIEAKHTYTGTMADGTSYTAGKYFTTWLYVKDNDGLEGKDSYFIAIREKTLDVEVNVAIDNGLWWLHKQQSRGTYGDGVEYGYWPSSYGFDVAFAGACTEAFELQGHLPSGDRNEDPYVETVQRGLNYLFSNCGTYSIGQDPTYCPFGNPDTNGNGIGLACTTYSGEILYEAGIALMAISSSGAPNRIATTGAPNVVGRAYKDIAQDMVDWMAWGQSDPYTGVYEGGWRYTANYGMSDSSVSQWPVIGMEAAERNFGMSGLTVPSFVRPELLKWLTYDQGSDGGFGYTGPGYWENTAKTGAGCAMLSWTGVPTSDTKFQYALSFLNTHWYDSAYEYTNFGDYYTMYAIMKGMRIPDPNVQLVGTHDWYAEYARYIIDQQNAYGGEYVVDTSWLSGYVGGTLATAWAMAVLTPTLVKPGPVAEAGPNIDNFPPTIDLEFDASGSYHRDPTKNIVLYEWDFDGDGTWDYSGPAPKVEHPYPAYYNPDGSIDWSTTAKDYTAILRVKDNNDPPLQDEDTRVVHITPPPWKPVADAGGPYQGSVGVPIQFDGSKSYAPGSKLYPPGHPWYETIAKYEWDLDNDGKFDDSFDVKPFHTWDTAGTYSVGLRVTDSQPSGPGGTIGPLDVDIKYMTVLVKSQPSRQIEVSPAYSTADVDQVVTFNGNVKDQNGNGVADLQVGIDDPIGALCATTTTDANGLFSYSTTANEAGSFLFDFYVADAVTKTCILNVGMDVTFSSFPDLKVKNIGTETVDATLSVNDVEQRTVTVNPGETKDFLQVNLFNPEVTPSLESCPLDAGVASGCIDSTGTVTVEGGELLRGSIYASLTDREFGACIGIGGDLPYLVEGEGQICLGTDGISLQGSAGPGIAHGNLEIKIVSFNSPSSSSGGWSPVTLMVTDPMGKQVGFSEGTGLIDQISWATYTGPHMEPQQIDIPKLLAGTYTYMLVGTENGDYTLSYLVRIGHATIYSQEYAGHVTEGEILVSILTASETPSGWTITSTAPITADNTPPLTLLTIGDPKYISGRTYVTSDTPFTLTATDAGSGVKLTAYRINSTSYDSGWLTYTNPFKLSSLADGNYTVAFNSTDNVGNVETTHRTDVTLFSWNYVFKDSDGRGTTLKICTAYKFFQFIAPDKDFGIKYTAKMTQLCKQVTITCYEDSQMRLMATAVDDKTCVGTVCDKQTGKTYWLIEHPPTYKLTICCKDLNGKAISGASVYLNGCCKGQTDSNGNLIITNVLAGTYTVTVKKCGYKDSSSTTTVTGDSTLTITLTPQTYTLTVCCKDSKGKGISGVSVYVNSIYRGTSDQNGKLVINKIMGGTCTVKVQKTGYKDTSVNVIISSDKTVTITMK